MITYLPISQQLSTCSTPFVTGRQCHNVFSSSSIRRRQVTAQPANYPVRGLVRAEASFKSRKQILAQTKKAAKAKPARASAAVDSEVMDIQGQEVDTRIPVTVITGFLGSGKTTLLNNILTKSHGKRIAVIENEFGEIDIDSELVASKESLPDSGDQIMMLNNGCMCCTVKEDLVEMLNDLKTRRDQFDQIVIETTGLANPIPIINTLMAHQDLMDDIRLDGVVTLVDAKHVEQHLDDKEMSEEAVNEAVEQIAYADRILLNKVDLCYYGRHIEERVQVSPADITRLEKRIRSINGMAQIQQVERAQIGVEYVLGIGGFELETVDKEVNADMSHQSHRHAESHSHEGHSHTHHSHAEHSETHTHSDQSDSHSAHSHSHDHQDHHHDHDNHVHDDSVSSVSIKLDGSMNVQSVNAFLGHIISMNPENMYRYKGLVAIAGTDDRVVFQGVHAMLTCMPDRVWRPDENRYCKMVFIGRDLDKEMIRNGFQECLVT